MSFLHGPYLEAIGECRKIGVIFSVMSCPGGACSRNHGNAGENEDEHHHNFQDGRKDLELGEPSVGEAVYRKDYGQVKKHAGPSRHGFGPVREN